MGFVFAYRKSSAQPNFDLPATIVGNASVGVTLEGRYELLKRARTVTQEWWKYTTIALENPTLVGTGSTYTVQAGDADCYLEYIVTASNAAGEVESRSGLTSQVIGAGTPDPEFTAGATITGQTKVGSTLSVSWSSINTDTTAIQWYTYTDAAGAGESAITGATSSTYALTASDEGLYIGVKVTIDNAGSDPVVSASTLTGAVAAADAELPPPAGAPVGAIPLNAANIASRTLSDGAIYLNTAGAYYYLVGDLTFSGAAFVLNKDNITLDLNGCTVTWNTGNQSTVWSDWLTNVSVNRHCIYTGDYNDVSYDGDGITTWKATLTGIAIKNGTLTTPATGIQRTFGISQKRSGLWSLTHLKIVGATGKDCYPVWGYSTTFVINDCTFISNTNDVQNRHDGPAVVYAGGRVYARRSVMIGDCSAIKCGNNSDIEGCFLSHDGIDTNGYGVWCYNRSGWRVYNNLIMPSNGRGVLANAGNNITIENNTILSWEAPNSEFLDGLNPPAVRARYGTTGLAYRNNFSLAIAGKNGAKAQDRTGGTGIYITNTNANTPYCTFTDNDVHAILFGVNDNSDIQAAPLTLEGQGAYSTALNQGEDTLSGNRFYSNHHMVRLSGRDGWSQQNNPLTSNEWAWESGPTAYAAFEAAAAARLAGLGLTGDRYTEALARYTTVLASVEDHINDAADAPIRGDKKFLFCLYSAHTGEYEYADVVDSTFGSDVDPVSYNAWNSGINGGMVFRDGFTHTTQLMLNATPLAGVRVTVTPSGLTLPSGAPMASATVVETDSSGYATLAFWRKAVTKGLVNTDPVNTTTVTQSTISITDLAGDPVAGTESKLVTHASLGATINMAST